jgi:hypothetical protein
MTMAALDIDQFQGLWQGRAYRRRMIALQTPIRLAISAYCPDSTRPQLRGMPASRTTLIPRYGPLFTASSVE